MRTDPPDSEMGILSSIPQQDVNTQQHSGTAGSEAPLTPLADPENQHPSGERLLADPENQNLPCESLLIYDQNDSARFDGGRQNHHSVLRTVIGASIAATAAGVYCAVEGTGISLIDSPTPHLGTVMVGGQALGVLGVAICGGIIGYASSFYAPLSTHDDDAELTVPRNLS